MPTHDPSPAIAPSLTIAKLARTAGVGVETVRYYQRRGLLAEPDRGEGPRRYGRDALDRLRFIRAAQTAGFTLVEIAELLELDATDDRERAREMARHRIGALDEQIARLRAARAALTALAHDCASGGDGVCPILAAFERR